MRIDDNYYCIRVSTRNPFKGADYVVKLLHNNGFYGPYNLHDLNPLKEGSIGQCFELSLVCDYLTYTLIFKDFKTRGMLLPESGLFMKGV